MKYKAGWESLGFTAYYLFQEISWSLGRHFATGRPVFDFLLADRRLPFLFGLINWTLCSLISYSLFYVLFYRLRKKIAAIAAYLLVGIPLMIALRYFMEETLLYALVGHHNYGDLTRQPLLYFMDNIYFTLHYSFFGIVFFFIQFAYYNQKRQNEFLLQSRQAELSFLRSQINPHFLFNSLNNVYALVHKRSDNALAAISRLSELLRYMLYEKEEKVPLQREVEYVQNFIALQLLRYDYAPCLDIRLGLPPEANASIVHLMLIPFVENAFKHGDLKDPAHPLKIGLKLEGQLLHFSVYNRKGLLNKDAAGGIGLHNIQKRLNLLYPGRHELTIDDNAKEFSIHLTLQL